MWLTVSTTVRSTRFKYYSKKFAPKHLRSRNAGCRDNVLLAEIKAWDCGVLGAVGTSGDVHIINKWVQISFSKLTVYQGCTWIACALLRVIIYIILLVQWHGNQNWNTLFPVDHRSVLRVEATAFQSKGILFLVHSRSLLMQQVMPCEAAVYYWISEAGKDLTNYYYLFSRVSCDREFGLATLT